MGNSILLIAILLLAPLAFNYFSKRSKLGEMLSPIVLSYLLGMLIRNFNLMEFDHHLVENISHASLLIALPLLLFSTNFKTWMQYGKTTLIAFATVILAGTIAAGIVAFSLGNLVADPALTSGMLVGVYTGGTPNLQAIGMAQGADSELIILLSATDIFCSTIILLFLLSFAKSVLGLFLKPFESSSVNNGLEEKESDDIQFPSAIYFIIASIFVVTISIGSAFLIFGDLKNSGFIMLMLTSVSILLSFHTKIRSTPGSYPLGEYFLLVFCIAIGMQCDFNIILESGANALLYTGALLGLTLIIHYFFAWMLKLDQDTVMVTQTAAIFGPPFIPQITGILKNRELLLAGMATSLVGIAIGNYVGLAVCYVLGYFLN